MLRKKITILFIIIFCSITLLSCGTTHNAPSYSAEKPNNDEEILLRGYILSKNNDNIVQIEEKDCSGIQLKTKYDYLSENPIIVYISEQQLNKLKDTYSHDNFSIPEISEEELTDCMYIKDLRLTIAEYNEYHDDDLKLSQIIKYTSERKISNNFSYIYFVLDLDYYGPVVFYAIFEKDENSDWIYNTCWAYTESKNNICKKDFLNKELIYNNFKDDMKYFGFISPGNSLQYTTLFLDNGQLGSIGYYYIYPEGTDLDDLTYCISFRIWIDNISIFDILQEGDEPEEVLKRFNEQAEQ